MAAALEKIEIHSETKRGWKHVELDHGEKPPEHERQHVLHDEYENVGDRNHEDDDGSRPHGSVGMASLLCR